MPDNQTALRLATEALCLLAEACTRSDLYLTEQATEATFGRAMQLAADNDDGELLSRCEDFYNTFHGFWEGHRPNLTLKLVETFKTT